MPKVTRIQFTYDSRTGITLRKVIAGVSAAGICSSSGRNEYTDFASYLVYIKLTAAERAVLNLGAAMWGRSEIEGSMLCHIYGIELHLMRTFIQMVKMLSAITC
jgi:hypothetical protein